MYKDKVDYNRVPEHIAIIMDGNGRWAKERGLDRTIGHQQGAETVHKIMEEAVRLGVKFLTLYTFSTENWNRPEYEVSALMSLLLKHMEEETFMKNNARFKVIGEIGRLPENVQKACRDLEEKTAGNTATCMVLALSYSSRWEITDAVKKIAARVENGELKAEDVNEELISRSLATEFMPDPELLIRTSGEERISNFLLWQIAYSELYFTNVYWPDFDEEELHKAICSYQGRQRRFGKTGEQIEDKK